MEIDFLPDPSIYQVIPYSITTEKFKEMNIFGPPTRLEPYYLLENRYELFKPYLTSSVSEKNLNKSSTSLNSKRKSNISLSNFSLSESSETIASSITDTSLSSISVDSSTNSLNKQYKCNLCRKSFSNKATYNSHLKTQKHKALLEKENAKNNKISSKNSKKNLKKRKSENLSISTSQNAAAIDAYKKLKQAEKVKKSHPSIAANVYWNAATVFWNCKLPQETANTLHQLLIILLQHENRQPKNKTSTTSSTSTSVASNSTSANPAAAKKPPELTTAQISHTVYLSCIALARLISENYGSKYITWESDEIFDEDEENMSLEATTLYLMALKERFGLCIESVQEFSDLLTTTTMTYSKFKENCNVILRKCNPVAILTKSPSTESAFYLMLNEVASFHSRLIPDHISLVLYGIASAHAYKEERWKDYVDVNKRICKIFNSLNFYWISCECLQDASRGVDLELLSGALMLSIRMDDRVNCKIIEKQIKNLLKDKEIPPDVQYLLNLSKCIRKNDYLWLEEAGEEIKDMNRKHYFKEEEFYHRSQDNDDNDDDDDNNNNDNNNNKNSLVTLHSIEQLYTNVKNRMDML
ncbi:hypothetical protein BCR32DRAFT_269504 [Anaeromyces robustus]|uniref:C2H2-type domain-containing protein n=1 Tax=Anaeromyces robustus TaxID=1754192 RepID=A0A1Y1X0U1_9FUNG|nr:hypothetical protein BCR32DRAFT_269504 [Anaeromyces robustus]|eukprot:ORX79421.1 hypothetical protein BCR32DRAFT_269504 [Anaeromyces robustus]